MATIADITTIKSIVISLLQASRSPYASTIDYSNMAFPSDTEIANAILYADFEIATLIANTPLHPYQSQFIAASPAAMTSGANASPVRNGMIVRVTGQVGASATSTFANTDISTTTDLVTKANHGLVTGQQVQLTTSGALPTGLSLATTYYVSVASSSTYGFSTTLYNAKSAVLIDITNQGTGTNTLTTQYTEIYEADSKDSIVEALNAPYLFASSQGNTAGFWYEEGTEFYTTCPNARIYYTDTTLTSVCQSPQPYTYGIAGGAVARLLKDGGDAQIAAYYAQQYQQYLAEVAGSAKMLTEIQSYQPKVAMT